MNGKGNDLRSALELLRTMPGQLVETHVEVDPAAELSGVYRYVGAGGTVRRPTNTPVDAGPYITLGMCYATHPDTGLSDVTIHRMCIQGRDQLSIFLQPGSRHIGAMAERATELGQPLPISISIGVDPAIAVTSCFEPPTTSLGFNELSIAGALRGEPVELHHCVSIRENCIARAEYVIEGEIQPGVRVVEDQHSHTGYAMPEFPGYNGAASRECWLIQVKAVTHREHPIMQTCIGPSGEHVSMAGIPTEASIWGMIEKALPGDWDRLISVGCSAGGAMSSLLGVSGDAPAFRPYLEENGAFAGESDRVFAAQIYCPIVDLEHADLAYEWMFRADKQCESSHAGPAEVMSPFKEALSRELASRYVDYFNGLGLRHPETGAALTLDPGGRSGPGYDYLMDCLNASATDYLTRRAQGRLPAGEAAFPTGREPWLTWDGTRARISDLDSYVLGYRRRMKPCTSFDKLEMDSGENQELGTRERDYVHFSPAIAGALEAIKDRFPGAYDRYHGAFAAVAGDRALAERVRLLNPLSFIGTGVESRQAEHYRIRVGSRDADTALSVSMTLALKLANAACGTMDYAIVWGQPHCQADYPGEVCDWIDRICRR